MTHSIPHKILRNTFFNTVGRVWVVLTGLILTPYIISHLGVERYGILALLGSVTGYFGLFDFGISASFVKYIAEFHARKENGKINQVVNTGTVFYLVFGVGIFLLACGFAQPVIALLQIPSWLRDETAFVLIAGVGTFCVSSALGAFASVPAGLQRMDVSNLINVLGSVPGIAGTVFVLEEGYGLPGMMAAGLLTTLLCNTAHIVAAFRMLPELEFNMRLFSRQLLGRLFSFGCKLQVSRLANLISFQTDKFLITGFLNIGLVAHYQLGSSIVSQARQIPLLLVSALVPAVSELEAREGRQALVRIFLRGSKYLIGSSTPLMVFIAVNAPAIMLAWMGPGYESASTVIRVLSLGYYLATVTGVASSIAAGVARTDMDMKFGVLMAAANLLLGLFLILTLGFVGMLAGTCVALAASSLYYFKLFLGYLGLPIGNFGRLFVKPACACVLPALATGAVSFSLYPMAAESGRWFALSLAAFNGLLFFALYTAGILWDGYFDEYDKALLRAKLPLTRRVFSPYAN